jgi:hypothetical protein
VLDTFVEHRSVGQADQLGVEGPPPQLVLLRGHVVEQAPVVQQHQQLTQHERQDREDSGQLGDPAVRCDAHREHADGDHGIGQHQVPRASHPAGAAAPDSL